MSACILLSWLRLLALDGKLAKAEPKTLRYRLFHAAARLVHGGRRKDPENRRILALGHRDHRRLEAYPGPPSPLTSENRPSSQGRSPRGLWNPGLPVRQPGHQHARHQKPAPEAGRRTVQARTSAA